MQPHVVERLGDDDPTVEGHTSAYTSIVADGCLSTLCGCYVQTGIHGVARKLHVAAVLDCEGLQWNDWQRVFHLATAERVAACQVDAFIVIFHSQVAASRQVDVVGLLWIKVADEVGTL